MKYHSLFIRRHFRFVGTVSVCILDMVHIAMTVAAEKCLWIGKYIQTSYTETHRGTPCPKNKPEMNATISVSKYTYAMGWYNTHTRTQSVHLHRVHVCACVCVRFISIYCIIFVWLGLMVDLTTRINLFAFAVAFAPCVHSSFKIPKYFAYSLSLSLSLWHLICSMFMFLSRFQFAISKRGKLTKWNRHTE